MLHRFGRLDELRASGQINTLMRGLGRYADKLAVLDAHAKGEATGRIRVILTVGGEQRVRQSTGNGSQALASRVPDCTGARPGGGCAVWDSARIAFAPVIGSTGNRRIRDRDHGGLRSPRWSGGLKSVCLFQMASKAPAGQTHKES